MTNVFGHFFMGRNKFIRIGIGAVRAGQAKPGSIIQMQLDTSLHIFCFRASVTKKGKVFFRQPFNKLFRFLQLLVVSVRVTG